MPETAKNYSITELEMCGLAMNIATCLHLLKKVDFDALGKDMVLSDFLSRQKTDDSNPNKLIPTSFLLKSQAENHFYQIDNKINQHRNDRYLLQTRTQVKSSGVKLPEIHGANKGLDPHVQPDKQRPFPSLPIQTVDKGLPLLPNPKPTIGQGRARLRRKVKTLQPISLPHQLPDQPITKHVLKTVMPLPKPTDQSQSHVTSNYA